MFAYKVYLGRLSLIFSLYQSGLLLHLLNIPDILQKIFTSQSLTLSQFSFLQFANANCISEMQSNNKVDKESHFVNLK